MSHRLLRLCAVIAATVLVAGLCAPAGAASWIEKRTYLTGPNYDGAVPPCDFGPALTTISNRFSQKEGRFWNSNLQIVSFEAMHERAERPWANNTIPRRFCSAIALLSDGVKRPVHYWIGEDTGEIGATWGVEWCIVGVDRNAAFNPACRMAQP